MNLPAAFSSLWITHFGVEIVKARSQAGVHGPGISTLS